MKRYLGSGEFRILLLLMAPAVQAGTVVTPAGHGHRALAYAADGRLGELVREAVTDGSGNGTVRLLYRERSPGLNPGVWQEVAATGNTSSNSLAEAALRFNEANEPTVVYLASGGAFRRATRGAGTWTQGSQWSLPAAYGNYSTDAVTYAFEPDGTPQVLILFNDFLTSAPVLVHGRLAEPVTAAVWTTVGGPFARTTRMEAFDYPGFENHKLAQVPRHLSLALDAAGGAHAVYSVDQTSVPISGGTQVRSSLFYITKPTAGTWSAPQTLLSPGTGYGDAGLGTSIAVAPDGTVAVASAWLPRAATGSPGDSVLRYLVKQPNGTWTDATAATAADNYQAGDGPQGTGLEPQLVFDEQSRPRITFTDHASQHFAGSGASSFSGQVRLAARTSPTSGAWTLSKLVSRGTSSPLDFQTFRPALASRFGQTAAAATSWTWNQSQLAYLPDYQIILTGTITLPPNQPPALSNLPDLTTAEDTSLTSPAFNLTDPNTPLGALTLTYTSSNPVLLPPGGNLYFSGSGASRTLTVIPAPDQSGTSTLTVTVSDGTLTASDSFLLTVLPVNDLPFLSDVTNKTTPEDTPTPAIAFSISDIETPAEALTLSGSSSNPALVPPGAFSFGGSGNARSGLITPAPDQHGTATITLTVSDGTDTASDTFLLTVTAVNDAPVISDLADLTLFKNTASAALAFTIGDPETAAASLTVSRASSNTTLLPVSGIVFGGSGGNRTVTLTPAANRTGSATVTLTVSDGSRTASDTFLLTVTDPLPVDLWRQTHFGANANNPAIAADPANPDGDALVNLLEYALGGNPNSTASAPAPLAGTASGKLTLTFTRLPANTDLTLTVQGAGSPDGPWADLARSTAGTATTVVAAGAVVSETGTGATRTVTVQDLFNLTDPLRRQRFLRLKITR